MEPMHLVHRPVTVRGWVYLFIWLGGLGGVFAVTSINPALSQAQEEKEPTAYMQSFTGYGMRSFVGDRWGSLQVIAVNPTPEDREVFVTIFNTRDQVDQYCKTV